ncbi:MAG: hypothetical protein EXQ70_04440 [Solirubrobacterales bacterium]|nr:hypothetical protein [Solirubrobacterales bacterium]
MSRSCPDRDEITGFMLGALEPGEARRTERHISRCEECRAEVRWLQPAVDVLAESVEQIEPPPELRQRLLGAINEEAEPSRSARRPARSWLGGFVLRPAAGLATIALLAAGLTGWLLHDGGGSPTDTIPFPPGGGMQASLEVNDQSATLIAHDMPPLEGDAVYQVWTAKPGGQAAPSSYFVPGQDGTGAAPVPEVLDGASEVMVTRELEPVRNPKAIPRKVPLLDLKLD